MRGELQRFRGGKLLNRRQVEDFRMVEGTAYAGRLELRAYKTNLKDSRGVVQLEGQCGQFREVWQFVPKCY